MSAKWKKKRSFVEMHVMVYTYILKMLALLITADSVDDVAEFKSLL